MHLKRLNTNWSDKMVIFNDLSIEKYGHGTYEMKFTDKHCPVQSSIIVDKENLEKIRDTINKFLA